MVEVITMEKNLLDVARVAEILKVSEKTVRNMIKGKKLKKVSVEGSVRVHPDDLQEYIDNNRGFDKD